MCNVAHFFWPIFTRSVATAFSWQRTDRGGIGDSSSWIWKRPVRSFWGVFPPPPYTTWSCVPIPWQNITQMFSRGRVSEQRVFKGQSKEKQQALPAHFPPSNSCLGTSQTNHEVTGRWIMSEVFPTIWQKLRQALKIILWLSFRRSRLHWILFCQFRRASEQSGWWMFLFSTLYFWRFQRTCRPEMHSTWTKSKRPDKSVCRIVEVKVSFKYIWIYSKEIYVVGWKSEDCTRQPRELLYSLKIHIDLKSGKGKLSFLRQSTSAAASQTILHPEQRLNFLPNKAMPQKAKLWDFPGCKLQIKGWMCFS